MLLEAQPSNFDTVIEALGSLLYCLDDFLDSCLFLLVTKVDRPVSFLDDELVVRLRHKREQLPEHVLRPFDAVKRLLWEHLQGTMGNLTGIVIWVSLARIGLSLVLGQNNLYVALRSKSPAVNQRHPCSHALAVNVKPCLHIVESVRDYVLVLVERLIIDVGSAIVDLVEAR